MDSTFKSYDEIFDSIKKKVQEGLYPKENTRISQNHDSDTGTDDDLEWEFTENADASVEELLEFRTDLPMDESLKQFAEVAQKRIKQASLVPVVCPTEEELSIKFYKELEKAEFFIAIQERFIQKSRLMIQKDQIIDISEFLTEMMEEYHNLNLSQT